MFNNPELIKSYNVYYYEHLDYLSRLISPEELFRELGGQRINFDKCISNIKELFKKKGWEGDGEISIIWLPPFVDTNDVEDTWGTFIWHVKQGNNGTSFIAAKRPLPFKRIKVQNDYTYDMEWKPIHILQGECEEFSELLSKKRIDLLRETTEFNAKGGELKNQIYQKLLGYTQCEIIADLSEFMDDCYLSLLMEVLQNGNRSNLKLRKTSVKIDLTRHNYEDEEFDNAELESLTWLSFQSIISDIYKAYRFEPFSEKMSKLIKGTDYQIDSEWREQILKHVIIRNCIQHHNWRLDASSLKTLGKNKIVIASDKNDIEINKWKPIELTTKELLKIIEILKLFVNDFSNHINVRVPERHYIKRKKSSNKVK